MPEVIDVRLTPEQFVRQSREHARSLVAASRRNAAAGDAVGVLACGWVADVVTVQAVTANAVLISGEAPQRLYFQTASTVIGDVRETWTSEADGPGSMSGVAGVLKAGRSALARSLEPAIVGELTDEWMELSEFSSIPVPSMEELERARSERLGGLDVSDFVASRRRDASEWALQAARTKQSGDAAVAVREAYAADMYAFEAYLTKSAVETGDHLLLTVRAWWDVAAAAIAAIPGLPDDVDGAVGAIRRAIVTSIGEPSATRLLAALPRH